MNNRITKTRLKTLFAYDTVKIVVITTLICVLLFFIFNLVTVRPSDGQDFYLMVGDDIEITNEGSSLPEECKKAGVNNFGFSYDILKINTLTINAGQYSSSYMINTYHQVHQDDVFVCSDYSQPTEEGEEKEQTLYEFYVKNYMAQSIKDYLTDAKEYVTKNEFYNVETGVWNEKRIDSYFRVRMVKDKRYKNEEQISKGIILEKERVRAIWNNAVTLENVLTAHPELLYKEETLEYQGGISITASYALNLGALNGKNGKLIQNAFKIIKKNDLSEDVYTSDGLVLLVGKNYSVQPELNFESLAFILNLIKSYSDFI